MLKEHPRSRQRVIRIFISSTFLDMKEEREELVKRVFPQLRRICEERGVTWGAVDLRWGITDEQRAEGKVLPICLNEIEECRPFFIGILGERYGYVPLEIPDELVEENPWLKEHRKCSITELEIRHGVLNNPEMADHAYFYFRDPAYVQARPIEQRDEFREHPTQEEIDALGTEAAQERAEDRNRRLEILKESIRNSGHPLRENYSDIKDLGKLILADLLNLIDESYPEGSALDPLDRDALDHDAYARAKFHVYISKEEYFKRLDEHASASGPPLVVLGESGAGKSALLANWVINYRRAHPDELVISHFIGATPYSGDWAAMIRRILGELHRHFDLDGEIPFDQAKLRLVFANTLHNAASAAQRSGQKIVLVIDALNQLEDRDAALELAWLPPAIPENVRLFLSTLPGTPLDELTERGWPILEVKPLTDDERQSLIRKYLMQYRKSLNEERMNRIASFEQTRNPLFLRTLLEELRIFGVHEHLNRVIEHYLSSSTVPELFERILSRLESDHNREWPGLVEDMMVFVWASRRGLSEEELYELLGTGGNPVPRAQWLQFFSAVQTLFVNRSGLINFSHDYIRQAVENRYLLREKDRKAAHQRLAYYFMNTDYNPRMIDEVPWQFTEAEDWERLHELLSDIKFLVKSWGDDQYELKRYWASVEESSELKLIDAYKPILVEPEKISEEYGPEYLARLLNDTGNLAEASSLNEFLIERFQKSGESQRLADILSTQALIHTNLGNLESAMKLHKQAEEIYREIGYSDGLSQTLGNQATLQWRLQNIDEALRLFAETERICLEVGNQRRLIRLMCNHAFVLRCKGELDDATEILAKAERGSRDFGDPESLRNCFGTQALIATDRGDYDNAIELHKEAEKICRDLGNPSELMVSLSNQALVHMARDELDQALALYGKSEEICRKLNLPEGLAISLNNQAEIFEKKEQPEMALPLASEAYKVAEDGGFAWLLTEIGPMLERLRSQME